MDFKKYIEEMSHPSDFCRTGINKEIYLEVIELALNAYPMEELKVRVAQYQKETVTDIQAFSRITTALAALIANGRKKEYQELWESMMDCCCRDLSRIVDDGRLDFSVKEILLGYKAMKPYAAQNKLQQWSEDIKKIDREVNYVYNLKKIEKSKLHNINIFNMTGEYLRESEGLTDITEYFRMHWPVQLDKFDENGMYQDPNNPIVYDIVTRGQIVILLGHGYRGEFYDGLDQYLEKSGFHTLFMQSSNFELPFGGRSNQFLFNDAYVAAICEYEAARYQKRGEMKIAGAYKRCAHRSIQSVLRWIKNDTVPKHIRNFYPVESKHGEEPYAYYDKYMVTLAVNAYIAFLFADDRIEEYPCPSEIGGYAFQTSEAFHKIFANCKGNFIEIDTKADFHYDATGLGRYHKSGIPSELAISSPFTATPNYMLSEVFCKDNISICAGWDAGDGKIQYLSELSQALEHSMEVIRCDERQVSFIIIYRGKEIKGCKEVRETYTIDENGVHIQSELIDSSINKIYYRVPLFCSNGKDEGKMIEVGENHVSIGLSHFQYTINTNGSISVSNMKYGNRNGEYYLGCIEYVNTRLEIHLKLCKSDNTIK